MDIHIHIEKRHFIMLVVLVSLFGVLLLGSAAPVNQDQPWHPLSQIAKSTSDTNSVDSDGNGFIDSADTATEAINATHADQADNADHADSVDWNDVENEPATLNDGDNQDLADVLGEGNDAAGSGIVGLGGLTGNSGSDIIFNDRPQSMDGLWINSGTAYFDGEIRTDVIQDRGGGSTVRFDSNINANNFYIRNLHSPSANDDAATKAYVDSQAASGSVSCDWGGWQVVEKFSPGCSSCNEDIKSCGVYETGDCVRIYCDSGTVTSISYASNCGKSCCTSWSVCHSH